MTSCPSRVRVSSSASSLIPSGVRSASGAASSSSCSFLNHARLFTRRRTGAIFGAFFFQAAAWKKNAPKIAPVLRRVKSLAWFKNEHDEELAAPLADLTPEGISELADELTRTRDGQLVIGRATPADEAARWTEAAYRAAALETFRALAPLYRLR